jgi:hypothetical protein
MIRTLFFLKQKLYWKTYFLWAIDPTWIRSCSSYSAPDEGWHGLGPSYEELFQMHRLT